MPRIRIPPEKQDDLLVECRRRCALCFGLQHDFGVKRGQIAHIDQDSSNASEENLVFLCFDHHDEYDSTTRQSKGLTEGEVRRFKETLLEEVLRQWDDGSLKRPLLQLKLLENVSGASPHGLQLRLPSGPPLVIHRTMSRFYHLQATNAHRAYPVNSVDVFLIGVEKEIEAGQFNPVWLGDDVRMRRRYEREDPSKSTPPVVGRSADVDLCNLVKQSYGGSGAPTLELCVALIPVNLAPHVMVPPGASVILHFVAKGVEADSETFKLRMSWTGEWSDDDAEMRRLLAFEVVDA